MIHSDTPFMRGIAEVLVGATGNQATTETHLSESVALLERPTGSALRENGSVVMPATEDVWLVQLIAADVQGSSGYYPAEVLRRDGPRVFPAGTHVYLDHPSLSEESDRPERSVRDLAGALIEAAWYDDGPHGKGLFAHLQVFSDHAHRVAELAPYVGMSIRARGVKEIDHDTGLDVVSRLLDGQSVDIVTHAGAGGRLLNKTSSGW